MGKGLRLSAILLAAVATPAAWSFFDDFLGNELGSNWLRTGLAREYHVADSLLTVTNVTYQAGEDYYANFQTATGYGEDLNRADFAARVQLHTLPGDQVFLFTIGNFFSSGYGYFQMQMFGYRDLKYLTFSIGGGLESSDTQVLAPSGDFELQIERVSGKLGAYVNGQKFFQSQYEWNRGQDQLTLSYAGDFENAPLSVDYVDLQVVPEPLSLISTGTLLLLIAIRRRSL